METVGPRLGSLSHLNFLCLLYPYHRDITLYGLIRLTLVATAHSDQH